MEIVGESEAKKILEDFEGIGSRQEGNHLTLILNRIAGWGAVISGTFLSAGVLLITTNVIRRALINKVIIGVYEFVEISMILAVTFAFAYTETVGGHVAVDSVFNKLPRLSRVVISCLNYFLYMAVLAVLIWTGTLTVFSNIEVGEYTSTLRITYIPFRVLYVLGMVLWAAIVVSKLLPVIRRENKK